MKIPTETRAALAGAVVGAVGLAVVGFLGLGWVTGAKSEAAAMTRADSAVVEALAPVCAAQFRRDTGVDANLVALRKLQQWSQGDYIEKGGWATLTGAKATAQTPLVARACGEILNKT